MFARHYEDERNSINANNAKGVMTNKQDDLDSLKQNLEKHFSESSVKTIGSMALFWARK